MCGRVYCVTVCQPGRDILVADGWTSLQEAKDFRDLHIGWLAQHGYRRDHASGVLCVRMRRGLEQATVSIIGRGRLAGEAA